MGQDERSSWFPEDPALGAGGSNPHYARMTLSGPYDVTTGATPTRFIFSPDEYVISIAMEFKYTRPHPAPLKG